MKRVFTSTNTNEEVKDFSKATFFCDDKDPPWMTTKYKILQDKKTLSLKTFIKITKMMMTYSKVEISTRKIKLTAEFLRRAILFQGRERLCYTKKFLKPTGRYSNVFGIKRKKKQPPGL